MARASTKPRSIAKAYKEGTAKRNVGRKKIMARKLASQLKF